MAQSYIDVYGLNRFEGGEDLRFFLSGLTDKTCLLYTSIKEAKAEVKMLRRDIIRLAKENGLRLASVATHPFSDWRTQDISPDPRYKNIVEDMQLVARANLIFGLHVHIGIEDRETAIHMMNHSRYFLPHLLALSTNSPFWLGMNTGLKSYRCKVFDKFPRTNIPD